ncbi:MAG: hypothetical protein JWN99_3021 [Ilumatobacteraceae bacterium]|nr:hypothetical protein [Ilumatobacteraceae bacterium]
MAELAARCRWCRSALPARQGAGRPREFCSQRCRQWDWVSRQRARELALSDGELVMARTELDGLHDDLFVLSCAVADTQRDLGTGRLSAAELKEALRWLLEAAEPLAARRMAPSPRAAVQPERP